MSTQLTDTEQGVIVSTVASFHGKKRMAFGHVMVLGGNVEDVRAEALRQAEAIRAVMITRKPSMEPVV